MIKRLRPSTRDTPDIAASPTVETIKVSAMPTLTARSCSNIKGSMATSVSHIHHQSEYYIYLKQQFRVHDDVKSVISGLNALDELKKEQRAVEEKRRNKLEWENEQKRDCLEKEEREKREERERKNSEKIQAVLGLVSLLTISSALVDWFDFANKFSEEGEYWRLTPFMQTIDRVVFEIIIIIGIIVFIFTIKNIWDAFKRK